MYYFGPFCLCEVVCGRGVLSELCRVGRIFGGLGMQGQPNRSSVRNIIAVSFTVKVTGQRKDVFEGGFNFSGSKARKKFDSTASVRRDVRSTQLGSNWGVISEREIN